MQQGNKRKVRMTPLSVVSFLAMRIFDNTGIGAASLLAAMMHECGHLLAAKRMGIPLRSLRLDFFCARIEVGERLLSYGEEWLLCASGPLFSLLFSLICLPLQTVNPFFPMLSVSSFLLGLLNLLPVKSFDGGRMTEGVLCRFFGTAFSFSVMRWLTLGFLFLLWGISVYFLLRAGGGLSLLFFSVSLLSRFLEKEKIN